MDAGDRTKWTRDQDERPLSELGRAQAEALAHELGEVDIEAIFASPALRARETVKPLAEYRGIDVQVLEYLAEKQLGEDTRELAERGLRAIAAMREAVGSGRVVAASHGDLIPATARLFAVDNRLPEPEPLEHRAQRYTIDFDGNSVSIERVEAGIIQL
jgi:broad specificity phosphatase PhoE